MIRHASHEANQEKKNEKLLSIELNKIQASIISDQKKQVAKVKENSAMKRIEAVMDYKSRVSI